MFLCTCLCISAPSVEQMKWFPQNHSASYYLLVVQISFIDFIITVRLSNFEYPNILLYSIQIWLTYFGYTYYLKKKEIVVLISSTFCYNDIKYLNILFNQWFILTPTIVNHYEKDLFILDYNFHIKMWWLILLWSRSLKFKSTLCG